MASLSDLLGMPNVAPFQPCLLSTFLLLRILNFSMNTKRMPVYVENWTTRYRINTILQNRVLEVQEDLNLNFSSWCAPGTPS